MNKRVLFTIAGAMLLFGGPLVLPAPAIDTPAGSAQASNVKPA